jgi:hypothetical protein
MVYPHELLEWLVRTHRLAISAEEVQEYWRHVRRYCDWALEHPASEDHIPIGMWADEATYDAAKTLKVFCFTLDCPLFRPTDSAKSKWPLFALRCCISLGRRTLNPLLQRVAWSMNVAFTGFRSMWTFDGQPELVSPGAALAGRKFAMVELRGVTLI